MAQYTQRLRQAQGLPPRHRTPRQPRPEVVEPQTPALTPREATWLILQREDKRDEDAPQLIAKLRGQHANLAEAIELTQDFVDLVRQRQRGAEVVAGASDPDAVWARFNALPTAYGKTMRR